MPGSGRATSLSKRGPVGIADDRLSNPTGFDASLGAVGTVAGPVDSLEGSFGLKGGAVPIRGPEGTFGGIDLSAAGAAGGLDSAAGSSFFGAPSVDMLLVVGVRLGRAGRGPGSTRDQLSPC